MTNAKRITVAIATGAVLVNALAPAAFAANTIEVSGNGAFSESGVQVNKSAYTEVNQSNNANISNNVSSNASTGGNTSNFNTGGDSVIRTGDAVTSTEIKNAANLNKASLSNCGSCEGAGTDVKISGNGAYSENGVSVDSKKEVFLNQDNNAYFRNNVEANANTGKNDNSFNTGGDSVIVTGDAGAFVDVSNKANANIATIGGGNGSHGGSSILINGNGAFSENGVDFNQASAIVLDQANSANIKNDIEADANTGHNDSTFNTGGFTGISTGDAVTEVSVDNAVNFNAASVDCGCVVNGADIKIAGNGAESENGVTADFDNALFNTQDNEAYLRNYVDDSAKTGKNDVSFSTSEADDPLVVTGVASSSTEISNNGNVNVLDQGSSLGHDYDFDFDFDLHGLWLSLNHWMAA